MKSIVQFFSDLWRKTKQAFSRFLDSIIYRFARRYYVLADPRDNSITLSRPLWNHIRHSDKAPKVFVFFIPSLQRYAFTIDPKLNQETQLADIQYNSRFRSIGFESLCPSVGRILYDYQLPHDTPVRLSVAIQTHSHSIDTIYVINKPSKN